jgi:hypothetical protein
LRILTAAMMGARRQLLAGGLVRRGQRRRDVE